MSDQTNKPQETPAKKPAAGTVKQTMTAAKCKALGLDPSVYGYKSAKK